MFEQILVVRLSFIVVTALSMIYLRKDSKGFFGERFGE